MGPSTGLRNHILLGFGIFSSLLFCCLKAELEIESTQTPISTLLGQNVTLPCLLTGDNKRILDLNIVGIRWKKMLPNGSEIDVYKFLDLRHHEIRNGSSIDERELRRGNFSLTLQRVRANDEGKYSCTVFVTPDKASASIEVQVLIQPNLTLSTTEVTVERGSEKTITCAFSKYYPEEVKIRWFKRSKTLNLSTSLDKDTYFTVPEENSDGTFSQASLLTVKPFSLEEHGDIYSCNVDHVSNSHGRQVTFTLKVKEPPLPSWLIALITVIAVVLLFLPVLLVLCFKPVPPKISDITGLDGLAHGKSTTLSCMVSGFKQKKIKIQFCVKKGNEMMEIGSWVYPAPKPRPQHEDTVDSSRTPKETAVNLMPNTHSSQTEVESKPRHEDTGDSSRTAEESPLIMMPYQHSSQTEPESNPRHGDTGDSSRTAEEIPLNMMPHQHSLQTEPESKPRHEDTVDSSKNQKGLITMIRKRYPFLVDPKPLQLVKSYFTYSCFCFADILTDIEKHKGAELIITVTHSALKDPLIIEKALEIPGDFLRLSIISAPQVMKHGEQVTLTCEIFTCSNQALQITWLKKDLMKERPTVTVYKKGKVISDKHKYNEKVKQDGHVQCTCSSITFTLKFIEDHGTKYICKVSNPAISQTLQSCLDTFVTAEPEVEQIQCSHKEPCVGREMELSCRIHSFNPKDLTVCWYKEDVMLASPEPKLERRKDGLFSTKSIFSYIPMTDDKGKVFKCTVDHGSFIEPKKCFWIMENLSVEGNYQ